MNCPICGRPRWERGKGRRPRPGECIESDGEACLRVALERTQASLRLVEEALATSRAECDALRADNERLRAREEKP